MNPTTIDIPALRRALADTAREIVALKKILRTRWVRPMAAEQKTLAALAVKATSLCILRAHLRGRVHVAKPWCGAAAATPECIACYQRMAERAADRYALWRQAEPPAMGASR